MPASSDELQAWLTTAVPVWWCDHFCVQSGVTQHVVDNSLAALRSVFPDALWRCIEWDRDREGSGRYDRAIQVGHFAPHASLYEAYSRTDNTQSDYLARHVYDPLDPDPTP